MSEKQDSGMVSKHKRIASMIGCAILGSVVGNVALSFANRGDSSIFGSDSGNPTDLVVPYSGYLEVDGVPLNGTRAVMFKFYNPHVGVNAYNETHDVTFYDGKFSVPLGQGRDPAPNAARFESMMLNGDKIEFAIEVDDGAGNFVALSGRQVIEAAPQAVWSANAADFDVAGGLEVAGNATFGQSITVANAVSAETVTTNALKPSYQDFGTLGTGAGGAAIYNDNTATHQALVIAGNNSAGGSRQLKLYDDVYVDDDLEVGRNATVTSDLDVGQTLSSLAVNAEVYRPSYQKWNHYGTGDGGASIYNDDQNYQALMITGNRSAGGSERKIELFDDVNVNGDLNVEGKINGFALTNEESLQAASGSSTSQSLVVTREAGFCFLVGVNNNPYNNTDNGHGGSCFVEVGANPTDTWQLRAVSESATSQICRARCIRY